MHIVLLVLMSLAVTTPLQPTSIYSASFPAEVELFNEAGQRSPNTRFAGVGMMNFSPTHNRIDLKGLQTIEVPHLGQDRDDKYEFFCRSFKISHVIPMGGGVFAFEGESNDLALRVTGRIRVTITRSPLQTSIVEDFEMNEHGRDSAGVIRRWRLPTSAQAKTLMARSGDVYFGGHVSFEWAAR